MAPGDPTLGLGLPRFGSQSVLGQSCLCCSPAPCQANLPSSGCSGLSPALTFLTGRCPQQPLEPLRDHEAAAAALGTHSLRPAPAQLEPDSLCMTVSLVYSSISPWMRRKRGIFPLYSCFRIVEYTSSPGHSGRGLAKAGAPGSPSLGLGRWPWS